MKLIALTAAALTALAPAAFASSGVGLTDAEQFEIRSLVPSADLSNLSAAQASALSDAVHHGDNADSARLIRQILG
ncbi:MAG: hypothetical protein R3D63_17750 [Paracoccaceae bacterium]